LNIMNGLSEIIDDIYAKEQADIVNDLVNGKQWYWCDTDKGTAYINPDGYYAYIIPKGKRFIKASAFRELNISEKLNLDYFASEKIGKYENKFGEYMQYRKIGDDVYACFYDKTLKHFPKDMQVCVSGSTTCATVYVQGVCLGYVMPFIMCHATSGV